MAFGASPSGSRGASGLPPLHNPYLPPPRRPPPLLPRHLLRHEARLVLRLPLRLPVAGARHRPDVDIDIDIDIDITTENIRGGQFSTYGIASISTKPGQSLSGLR